MDNSWVYGKKRNTIEYIRGVTSFVIAATTDGKVNSKELILCPCIDCKNERKFPAQQTHSHLLTRGFMLDLKIAGNNEENVMIPHRTTEVEESIMDVGGGEDGHDNEHEVGYDDADAEDLDQMMRDTERAFTDDRDYLKFKNMVDDSKTPIYNGCKPEHNKLHVVLTLLQLKASNGWSDKSLTELL